MTVRVDWNAGNGHAWTGVVADHDEVILSIGGRDFALTAGAAESLAADLLRDAAKVRAAYPAATTPA